MTTVVILFFLVDLEEYRRQDKDESICSNEKLKCAGHVPFIDFRKILGIMMFGIKDTFLDNFMF